jgi:predicted ATPase
MLTRLEVDGFKNLVGFSADFGAFTCIAGPNSVGKSNIFDAIQLLSLLTENTIMDAALKLRGSSPETSDIRDLFWTDGKSSCDTLRIAAEMIVPASVTDDFGRPAEASSTFLRYEIAIGYMPPSAEDGLLGRLVLESEKLDYITQGDAWRHLRFPHSARNFRSTLVMNKRRTKEGYITVRSTEDAKKEIVVHADGGSRGLGQTAAAHTAPRTIVGTSNTSATPTILAARREMQSWRLLALEPSAMRQPDKFQSDSVMTTNGGHMPAALFRLATVASRKNNGAESVYADITSQLSELVPVSDVRVVKDDVRQLLTLEVTDRSKVPLPASSLSDGTLRFLALAIMSADPELTGLICMEEPENGIHPAKLGAMTDLLHGMAVDLDDNPGADNPLRQVIIATHSPGLVQLQRKEDLVFALESTRRGPDGRPIRVLACRALDGTWRAEKDGSSVGQATIIAYLSKPPGAQIDWIADGWSC